MRKTKANNRRSLQRMVRLLGEADRISAKLLKQHCAILREVGHEMRAERQRQRMSLRKLAWHIGVSAPFLSDMERGNRKYSIEWCEKAMRAMQPNDPSSATRPT